MAGYGFTLDESADNECKVEESEVRAQTSEVSHTRHGINGTCTYTLHTAHGHGLRLEDGTFRIYVAHT